MIKAMPIEPTSPAKHFAFPFGRKLKIQNTNEARTVDMIKQAIEVKEAGIRKIFST
jgi:hypothetical protein